MSLTLWLTASECIDGLFNIKYKFKEKMLNVIQLSLIMYCQVNDLYRWCHFTKIILRLVIMLIHLSYGDWNKDSTDTSRSASYNDLLLKIGNADRLQERNYDKRDHFNFPLWTYILHLHVATFQQHLHMEYISLRWYDFP